MKTELFFLKFKNYCTIKYLISYSKTTCLFILYFYVGTVQSIFYCSITLQWLHFTCVFYFITTSLQNVFNKPIHPTSRNEYIV